MDWVGMKALAAELTVSKDALHVYVAVAVQAGAALAVRRPLSNWLPWFVTLAAVLFNEGLDIALSGEPKLEGWQLVAARHDLVNTMVMPTALMLLCRFAPRLFRPRAGGTPPPPA